MLSDLPVGDSRSDWQKQIDSLLNYADESCGCDNDTGYICPPCAFVQVMTHEKEKNDQLRSRVRELEEAQRWRKWPEEKPEDVGTYQCIFKAVMYPTFLHIEMLPRDSGMVWNSKVDPSYWRPVGPLPKEGE